MENSEDEERRLRTGSIKKKVINASSRFTHLLGKRWKRKISYRDPIGDVRDAT
ncbi:Sec14 cytosolic factor [Sesbania bispinosa]|nr:Sec14 cytosolic factor [Sesbania bispinosa]